MVSKATNSKICSFSISVLKSTIQFTVCRSNLLQLFFGDWQLKINHAGGASKLGTGEKFAAADTSVHTLQMWASVIVFEVFCTTCIVSAVVFVQLRLNGGHFSVSVKEKVEITSLADAQS